MQQLHNLLRVDKTTASPANFSGKYKSQVEPDKIVNNLPVLAIDDSGEDVQPTYLYKGDYRLPGQRLGDLYKTSSLSKEARDVRTRLDILA